MRLLILCTLLFYSVDSLSQTLLVGNIQQLCISESQPFETRKTLPENISNYSVIYVFSNATTVLTNTEGNKLINFVEKGGALYLGGENWPLQAEFNQLTSILFNKESYGSFSKASAEVKTSNNNLKLDELGIVPAGTSTIAFPMDYRLKVEAWVEDQPLIFIG